MKDFNPYLPIIGFLIALPLTIWAAMVERRRTKANLQKLAAQLGLELVSTGISTADMHVTGALYGKRMDFFIFFKGGGRATTTWAAITAQPSVAGALTFSIYGRGCATVKNLIDPEKFAMGDPAFDHEWFVETNQPAFLRAALIPELRQKLMTAIRGSCSPKFELKSGKVKYEEFGMFTDAKLCDRFVTLADVVCDLADVAEVAANGQRQK